MNVWYGYLRPLSSSLPSYEMWRKSSVARATAMRICSVIVYTVHRSILAACGPRFCNAKHWFFFYSASFYGSCGSGAGIDYQASNWDEGHLSGSAHYRFWESLTNDGISGKEWNGQRNSQAERKKIRGNEKERTNREVQERAVGSRSSSISLTFACPCR